jgi:hypothetical protein
VFDQCALGARVGGLRLLADLGAGAALGIALAPGSDSLEFSPDA